MPAIERVKTKEVVHLSSLAKISRQFLLKETQGFTSETALDENRAQALLVPPNKPTRMVLDRGRGGAFNLTPVDQRQLVAAHGRIKGMLHTVSFQYVTTSDVFQAVADTYAELRALTPQQSPPTAIHTYYFWCEDKLTGKSTRKIGLLGVKHWIERLGHSDLAIHILGPTIEYRRTVIYRGNNRPKRGTAKWSTARASTSQFRLYRKLTDKVKTRHKFAKRGIARVQFKVQRAIGEIVRHRMVRRYPGIAFGYGFVKSREAPLPVLHSLTWRPSGENIHIPRLLIKPKTGKKK